MTTGNDTLLNSACADFGSRWAPRLLVVTVHEGGEEGRNGLAPRCLVLTSDLRSGVMENQCSFVKRSALLVVGEVLCLWAVRVRSNHKYNVRLESEHRNLISIR